jgi:hypothetical protein
MTDTTTPQDLDSDINFAEAERLPRQDPAGPPTVEQAAAAADAVTRAVVEYTDALADLARRREEARLDEAEQRLRVAGMSLDAAWAALGRIVTAASQVVSA